MKTLTMKKIAIALAISATLTGCANWGGYAGGGAGAGLGYLAANAANASPATRGLVTAAGAIFGAQVGEKAVFKAGLKPLAPAVGSNMTKLTDEARTAFKRSMEATQAADDAEMLCRTSPDDTQARNKLRESTKAERTTWNAYAGRRDQLIQAVNTAQHQGFDVEKFHDAAAELLQMEVPVFGRVSNRKS